MGQVQFDFITPSLVSAQSWFVKRFYKHNGQKWIHVKWNKKTCRWIKASERNAPSELEKITS